MSPHGGGAVGPILELFAGVRVSTELPALVQALGECGPPGVTALRQLLRHPDTYVRAAAAEQLGYEARRDDAIVPDLVALLKDSNLVVRGRALTALGNQP